MASRRKILVSVLCLLASGCERNEPSRFVPPSAHDRLRFKAIEEISAFYLAQTPRPIGGATLEFEVEDLYFWTSNGISPVYFVLVSGSGLETVEGFEAPPRASGNYGGVLLQRKVDGSIRALSAKMAAAEISRMKLSGNCFQVTLKAKRTTDQVLNRENGFSQ